MMQDSPTETSNPELKRSDILSARVTVRNPMGLHMRPAAAFASLAQAYPCDVTIRLDERRVNGKSWLDLLLLAAPEGTELMLEVAGQDAAIALQPLAEKLGASSIDAS